MTILDGKRTSEALYEEIRKETNNLIATRGKVPHLAIVRVGEDPASITYVRRKIQACQQVGFLSTLIERKKLSEKALLKIISELNADASIDGIIVQLPLPSNIQVEKVIQHIQPEKDVDGLHPYNCGRMACRLPSHVPATPAGILTLLKAYNITTKGKHCVVVGRSRIVGMPLSILMSRPGYPGNATVTLCHSQTRHLSQITRQADILVAALGKPAFIKKDMVKKGAIVIDVGITRVQDSSKKRGYRLQGDVDFDKVVPQCSFITPVPGGVGPMTIAALLRNTLQAATGVAYSSPLFI